ncbi:MAG: hypothetical protein ACTHJ7_11200, partial [Candidatus Nitrosocosmicus sp.]
MINHIDMYIFENWALSDHTSKKKLCCLMILLICLIEYFILFIEFHLFLIVLVEGNYGESF